jgi:Gti1/Pac2 family transcription factor
MAHCCLFLGTADYINIYDFSANTHAIFCHQGNDYTRLQTIDDIEQLRNIRVPHGIYVSSKGSYKRADTFPCEPDDDESIYASSRPSPPIPGRPGSSSSNMMMVPAQAAYMRNAPTNVTRPQSPLSGSLPRLSSVIGGHAPPLPVGHPGSPSSRPYAPRSAEGSRVLNAFRIAL